MQPNSRQLAQHLETRQEQGLALRIEQSNLLEMAEQDFQRLIVEVEHSPLFDRLRNQHHLIRYKPFLRSDLARDFFQPQEGGAPSPGSVDIASLLEDKKGLVGVIQGLGMEKFKKYFLCPETGLDPQDIARDCGLTPDQVDRMNRLIDEFCVSSEFYFPSAIADRAVHYSRVAELSGNASGGEVRYFSPAYARGRYLVDYERFERLCASGQLSRQEAREVRLLFRKLEFINRSRFICSGYFR